MRVEPKTSVASERYLTNDSDDPITHTIDVSTKVFNSATTTVTTKSEISTPATKITVGAPELGIGAEFTQTFSFSNEV